MLFNLNAFALSGRDYLIAYVIPGRCRWADCSLPLRGADYLFARYRRALPLG